MQNDIRRLRERVDRRPLKPAGRRVMALVDRAGGILAIPPHPDSPRVRAIAEQLAEAGYLRVADRSGGWATFVDDESLNRDPTPYTLDELWSR